MVDLQALMLCMRPSVSKELCWSLHWNDFSNRTSETSILM